MPVELSPEIREAIAAEVAAVFARTAASKPDEYLTAKEAGALMRCHPETVLRMARDGKLRSVGSGKLLRIVRSSIEQHLAAKETAPAA